MRSIFYREISAAVLAQCRDELYEMSALAGSQDANLVIAAVNQMIDAHLEVCLMPHRGDRHERKQEELGVRDYFWFSSESLPVLLRRLLESESEAAEALVVDILSTLEIHVDSGCFEIVSPADEPGEEDR